MYFKPDLKNYLLGDFALGYKFKWLTEFFMHISICPFLVILNFLSLVTFFPSFTLIQQTHIIRISDNGSRYLNSWKIHGHFLPDKAIFMYYLKVELGNRSLTFCTMSFQE